MRFPHGDSLLGNSGGEYLKSFVYGAMDGLITTFAVVSAVVGGGLAIGTVLIMGACAAPDTPFSASSAFALTHVRANAGFANMLADGVSMGFGDFLSSTAEYKFAKMERAREMWEVCAVRHAKIAMADRRVRSARMTSRRSGAK